MTSRRRCGRCARRKKRSSFSASPGWGNRPTGRRAGVLLLLAEHDRIIDNARTRTFVGTFASADKTVVELSGTHHTLEFEPDPRVFLDPLLGWLDKHSPA